MTANAYGSNGISVREAKGLWITAIDGTRYIDGCAGTFNVGLGYGHEAVVAALKSAIDTGFLHGSGGLRTGVIEQAEADLVSISPEGLDRCHLKGSTGGSTAVEQALRHAWAVTDRKAIVSFEGSHHGQTIVSTLVSGMEFRKRRLSPVQVDMIQVPSPDCYRCAFGKSPASCKRECALAIAEAIDANSSSGEHDVAAMVAEPVLGAGGGIIPPSDYWEIVASLLHERGVMLIADEVQTFGRVGGFLASSYFHLTPQFVALAKSITGIGVPGAGALLLRAEHCILGSGERSLTGGGSNLVSSAVVATLQVMKQPGFFEQTMAVAENLSERLEVLASKFACIGCVRAIGLMTGIEIVHSRKSRVAEPKLAECIIDRCKDAGLLLRQSHYKRGGFVKIRPALTITHDEADELCRRLEWALQAAIA